MNPTYKPFDLEAAKAGVPIICRDGRAAKFIAYVPEARDGCRILAFLAGDDRTSGFYDNGNFSPLEPKLQDLFMAPVKRTVWVNFMEDVGPGLPIYRAYAYETRAIADDCARKPARIACIEIEFTEGQGL